MNFLFGIIVWISFLSNSSVPASESMFAGGLYIESGKPGSLGSRKIPGSAGIEIRSHENSNASALDVLSRAGITLKRQIPAAKFHNYGLGPGVQIDQVGPGAGLIIKQSANGNRMPESKGNVSNAPFLEMNRAADNGAKKQSITVFDRFGNLRFESDDRQIDRSITVQGADLRISVPSGNVIIAEQPIVIPRVSADQDGKLFGAIGILNRELALWDGNRWNVVQIKPKPKTQLKQNIIVPRIKQNIQGKLFGTLGMMGRKLAVWDGERWSKLRNLGQTEQELIVPRINPDEAGKLYGSIGMRNGLVTIWNGGKWINVQKPAKQISAKKQQFIVPRINQKDREILFGTLRMIDRKLAVWDGEKWAKLRSLGQTEQELIIPRIKPDEKGRLYGSIGMRNRLVSVWNGETWLPMKYNFPEGRRKNYTRLLTQTTLGIIGGFVGSMLLLLIWARVPVFRNAIQRSIKIN